MGIQVRTLRKNREAYAAGIAALESGATYPLGTDSFHIDHGDDYYAFFDRLGTCEFDIALDGSRIVAVCARVLRESSSKHPACWYICDLKVHPDYRGQRIPSRIARSVFPRAYARCRRGYGISMNPPDRPNPVVRLARRVRFLPATHVHGLQLYSWTASEVQRAWPLIQAHRDGELGFADTHGVKDIVLASTGAPMPLLHVQFGPHSAPTRVQPEDGAVHMLCTPTDDALCRALNEHGFEPSATASAIAHGLAPDFSFVLSNEI